MATSGTDVTVTPAKRRRGALGVLRTPDDMIVIPIETDKEKDPDKTHPTPQKEETPPEVTTTDTQNMTDVGSAGTQQDNSHVIDVDLDTDSQQTVVGNVAHPDCFPFWTEDEDSGDRFSFLM